MAECTHQPPEGYEHCLKPQTIYDLEICLRCALKEEIPVFFVDKQDPFDEPKFRQIRRYLARFFLVDLSFLRFELAESPKKGNIPGGQTPEGLEHYFQPKTIGELEKYLCDKAAAKKPVFFKDDQVKFDVPNFKRYLPGSSLVDLTILNQRLAESTIEQLHKKLQRLIGESPKLTIENFENRGKNQRAIVIMSQPKTKEDVKAVIAAVVKYNKDTKIKKPVTLRCIGAGHSWGPLFVDEGNLLLDVSNIESDYPNKDKIRFRDGNLVDIMTGVTTGDFKKFQLRNKVNLPCNVILDVVQMVSVVASGCHGVGWDAKTPGDYIKEMRIFQADGELHQYTSENEEMMKAVSANFGALGVIYDITLQLENEVKIKTDTQYEALGNILLDPEKLGTLVQNNWSVELVWFPFNKRAQAEAYKYLHISDSEFQKFRSQMPLDVWNSMRKLCFKWDAKDDEVWIRKINHAPTDTDVENETYYAGQDFKDCVSQKSLELASNFYTTIPFLVPLFSATAFTAHKHVLYPQGTIYQELVHGIHFRNHIHMGPVRDMEFAFDMKKKDDGQIDFARVCEIIKVVTDTTEDFYSESKYPLNISLEMRFMSYSDSFMNPAAIGNPRYGGSGHVFYIEVLSLTDTPHFQDFCIQIAQKWMAYEGMPHLAKEWDYIPGISEYIQNRMQDNIIDFQEQFTNANANADLVMINSALKSILGM